MTPSRKYKYCDEFPDRLVRQKQALQYNYVETNIIFAVIMIVMIGRFAFAVDPNTSIVPFNKTLAAEIKPQSIGIAINAFKIQFDNTADHIFRLFFKLSKLYSEDTNEEIYISSLDSSSDILQNIDDYSPSLQKIKTSYLLNSIDTKDNRSADNETEIRVQLKRLYERLEITSTQFLQSLNVAPQNELLKIRKKIESEKIGLQKKIDKIREVVKNNINDIREIKSSSFSSSYSESYKQEYETIGRALESAQKKLLFSKGQLERAKKDLESQEYLISILDQAIDTSLSTENYTNDPFVSEKPRTAADQVQIKLAEKCLLQSPTFKGFEDRSGKAIDTPVFGVGKQVYASYTVQYMSAAGLTKNGILKILLTGQDKNVKMWRCSAVFLDTDKILEFE